MAGKSKRPSTKAKRPSVKLKSLNPKKAGKGISDSDVRGGRGGLIPYAGKSRA